MRQIVPARAQPAYTYLIHLGIEYVLGDLRGYRRVFTKLTVRCGVTLLKFYHKRILL